MRLLTTSMTAGLIMGLGLAAGWHESTWARDPGVRRPPPVTSAPATTAQPQPILKHVGVFGPVPGGRETAGLVQLLYASRDRLGTPVYLHSSHPNVAAVPTGVMVVWNTSDASFKVTTAAVTAPTEVTITACSKRCSEPGAETKTATVIVRPPQLSSLACTPQQVPVGTTTTCTVWLDGTAKADTFVLTTSPEYGSQLIPYIKVPAGQTKGARPVPGRNDGLQPRGVTVNAAYGGVSRSTQLTIGPAYLNTVAMAGFKFNDGRPVGVVQVRLHASAPARFNFRMKVNPATALLNDYGSAEFWIPAGKQFAYYEVVAHPVAADTPVKIDVIANFQGGHEQQSTMYTVRPARMIDFKEAPTCHPDSRPFHTTLCPEFPDPEPGAVTLQQPPPGGREYHLAVWLEGRAPANGADVALSYLAPSVVTGPPAFKIPKNNRKEDFKVTVFPCPQALCEGKVRATYLGQSREFTIRIKP